MEMDKKTFKIEDENGNIKEAELLSVFSKDDIEYAVYSIDKDEDTSDLFASRIITDENGEDKLVDIEDTKEKEEIINIIKDMLK